MHNIVDDNELDRLSREAAWKYNVPGEANWEKMRAELDIVLPVQEDRKKPFLFWWLLPVLLLGGVTYWWLENKNAATTTAQELQQVSKKAVTTNSQASPIENQAPLVNKENFDKKNITNTGEEKQIELPKILSAPIVLVRQDQRKTDHHKPFSENEKGQIPPSNSDKTTTVSTNPAKQFETDKPVQKEAINSAAPAKENRKINIPSTTEHAQVAEEINTILSHQTNIEGTAPTASAKKEPINAVKGKGWSFALLAGVDKSTVKFKYGNDPGVNIGLLAGYHFNSRWSLHTGAVYTQKNYKMAGEDFTPPKGSWLNNYKLENVKGYCRMWEVPLLARYMVNNEAKNKAFISTGLSSYFMTKEKYNYFFYNAGVPTTRTTTYNSTDTHILSIAHLSAGFESQLNRTLSLQIEPYAKIPLNGVGLGNIKLSSFGINFAVQYRQPAKK